MKQNLFAATHEAILEPDPNAKCTRAREIQQNFTGLSLASTDVAPILTPGRPVKPELVAYKFLPKRSFGSLAGRAALLHAICHIEFNAINLALDAVYRFQNMPKQYYQDWLQVAVEESYHFSLLREYLKELGFDYGSFAAHDGLWQMAVNTSHDVLVRMALVPRVMEARGLDVTPDMIKKFKTVNDVKAIEILEIIMRDEVGHVTIGNRWFDYCCNLAGVSKETKFKELLAEYGIVIKPPIAKDLRQQAGFSSAEIDWLSGLV